MPTKRLTDPSPLMQSVTERFSFGYGACLSERTLVAKDLLQDRQNATHYLLDIIKERLAFDENDMVMTQDGELAHDC
jgi:hypothetical protein